MFKKTIGYNENKILYEKFSRHIFEHVFDYTMFEFNIQSSTFKLFPCLLTSNTYFKFFFEKQNISIIKF